MKELNDVLGYDLKIYQNQNWFCFSIDSVILANFANIKYRTKKILDIDSKEVLIGSPKDLGIKGNDLIEDYISTLNNINLTGTINSERLKEELSLRRKM